MISTDSTYTGAGTVTPPAVGPCTTGQIAWMAPAAAPIRGTGLPVTGVAVPFRLRGLTAAGTTSGVTFDATVRPSVQTKALEEYAVAGVPSAHISTTPGDLPPEDPLS